MESTRISACGLILGALLLSACTSSPTAVTPPTSVSVTGVIQVTPSVTQPSRTYSQSNITPSYPEPSQLPSDAPSTTRRANTTDYSTTVPAPSTAKPPTRITEIAAIDSAVQKDPNSPLGISVRFLELVYSRSYKDSAPNLGALKAAKMASGPIVDALTVPLDPLLKSEWVGQQRDRFVQQAKAFDVSVSMPNIVKEGSVAIATVEQQITTSSDVQGTDQVFEYQRTVEMTYKNERWVVTDGGIYAAN